jgi:hypothetical protein
MADSIEDKKETSRETAEDAVDTLVDWLIEMADKDRTTPQRRPTDSCLPVLDVTNSADSSPAPSEHKRAGQKRVDSEKEVRKILDGDQSNSGSGEPTGRLIGGRIGPAKEPVLKLPDSEPVFDPATGRLIGGRIGPAKEPVLKLPDNEPVGDPVREPVSGDKSKDPLREPACGDKSGKDGGPVRQPVNGDKSKDPVRQPAPGDKSAKGGPLVIPSVDVPYPLPIIVGPGLFPILDKGKVDMRYVPDELLGPAQKKSSTGK